MKKLIALFLILLSLASLQGCYPECDARSSLTPRRRNSDFFLDVARGKVPGHTLELKFGENPQIDNAATFEDVWDGGGTYAFYPTTAQAMESVSSLAADTGNVLSSGTATGGSVTTLIDSGATFVTDTVAAFDIVLNDTNDTWGIIVSVDSEIQLTHVVMGKDLMEWGDGGIITYPNESGDSYRVAETSSTGAGIIHVYGLDNDWLQQSESVVLNGVTPVDLVHSYVRQFRTKVTLVGSNGFNVGNITTQIDGAGTTSSIILIGNSQTLMAVFAVPGDKMAYMLGFQNAIGGKVNANVAFQGILRPFGDGFRVQEAGSLIGGGSSTYEFYYPIPLPLPPRMDVVGRASSDTNATVVDTKFSLIIVDM